MRKVYCLYQTVHTGYVNRKSGRYFDICTYFKSMCNYRSVSSSDNTNDDNYIPIIVYLVWFVSVDVTLYLNTFCSGQAVFWMTRNILGWHEDRKTPLGWHDDKKNIPSLASG